MKSSSLPLSGLAMALLLLGSSCKKEAAPTTDTMMTDAIITGGDLRACACCGGLMVTFTSDPKPYSGAFKLIDNYADLNINPKQTFPFYVKISYVNLTKCSGNSIQVTKLEKQ